MPSKWITIGMWVNNEEAWSIVRVRKTKLELYGTYTYRAETEEICKKLNGEV